MSWLVLLITADGGRWLVSRTAEDGDEIVHRILLPVHRTIAAEVSLPAGTSSSL